MSNVSTISFMESDEGSIFTSSELGARGINRMQIKRLTDKGVLERITRGVYRLADQDSDSRLLWAAISKKNPEAVFCLESAAAFHGITQSMAPMLSIALPKGYLDLSDEATGGVQASFLKWKAEAMSVGVEVVDINGVAVKITSAERTVVDMFRYSPMVRGRGASNRDLIDLETFHDCLTRYLDMIGPAEATSKIRKVAKKLELWDKMSDHVRMVVMSMTSSPSP